MKPHLVQQCLAEMIGTFTLIFVGVGAIDSDPGLLGAALAHGLASGFWDNHLVYGIGPLLGGGATGIIHGRFLIHPGDKAQ